MKILQISAYAAPYEGNFIQSLKQLALEMQKHGFETLFTFPESAKKREWCIELGKNFKVYFINDFKARVNPKTYVQMKKIFVENPDIAIAHSHFELYDVPLSVVCPSNVKVFWHLHDAIGANPSKKSKLFHTVQYRILHRNAHLLSVSEKHKEYVESLGFPKKNAYYVPNGLDLGRVRMTSPEKKEYDFGILGWDYMRKGVDLCVAACKTIPETMKVLVVSVDTVKQHLEAEECKNIQTVNAYPDINQVFDQINCFLHISRAEGLSYALLEAIYAGLPVICSDIRENSFARVFPTVTMVKNEDVTAISNAMRNYRLPEPDKIRESRRIIEEHYSIASWVNAMRGFYLGKNE